MSNKAMSHSINPSKLESMSLTNSDLQSEIERFTYFSEHVDWLLGPARDAVPLRKLIENTREVVQSNRSKGWSGQLSREDHAMAVRPEDRWERTIWRKWRPYPNNMPVTEFHHLAPRVLTYQLPLYDKQESQGWGKIDLVGVSNNHLPVVIEVKAEQSSDSPLAVVLEAVRYGVALKEIWLKGLRDEWSEALSKAGIDPRSMPEQLTKCQLICAAPQEYWKRRGPTSSEGKKRPAAWSEFRKILKILDDQFGLPVELIELQFCTSTLREES